MPKEAFYGDCRVSGAADRAGYAHRRPSREGSIALAGSGREPAVISQVFQSREDGGDQAIAARAVEVEGLEAGGFNVALQGLLH